MLIEYVKPEFKTVVHQQYSLNSGIKWKNEDIWRSIRKQIISDLTIIINKWKVKNYKTVLTIDANEAFDRRKRDYNTCIRFPTNWSNNENPRLHRGARNMPTRIRTNWFILYTLKNSEFVTTSNITPYNMITPSDHRGIFIDINIKRNSRIRLMKLLTIQQEDFKPVKLLE